MRSLLLSTLLLSLTPLLLPSCKLLDQAHWTAGTTYNPDTHEIRVEIGKSPIK